MSLNFIALYRSPSHPQEDFETFSDNFEMTVGTQAQKGSFLTTIIVTLTLNPVTGIVMIKRASKVVPLKV